MCSRVNASMPDQDTRARDPFFTVRRAEAYLENGRQLEGQGVRVHVIDATGDEASLDAAVRALHAD